MTTPKTGPLTQAELQAIWESTTDESFYGPLEEAGVGNGFEAYAQAWAQMERVSQAVDVTTQAMFILPWSGQTAPPAAGGQFATVELTLSRTKRLTQSLTIAAGTLVEEVATDWSYSGGVATPTGRRFVTQTDVVFVPGQAGPLFVVAAAERVGFGYNNPEVGSISLVVQPGSGYANTGGSVVGQNYQPTPAVDGGGFPAVPGPTWVQHAYLVAADRADAFVPGHVGQYVEFVLGANSGACGRVVGWQPPDPTATPPSGGTVELGIVESFQSHFGNYTDFLTVGDAVTFFDGVVANKVVGYGVVRGQARVPSTHAPGQFDQVVTLVRTENFVPFDPAHIHHAFVLDQGNGVTMQIDVLLETVAPGSSVVDYALESGTAQWQVLDWVADWGLSVSNADARPTGGVSAFLDTLGRERDIDRAGPSEDDDDYRQRVATPADVVSPNAILRAINGVLKGNVPFSFLEAGTTYPGFYFDVDFYDYDAVVPTGGSQTGVFVVGEKVTQLSTKTPPFGTLAIGRALVDAGGSLVGIAAPWGTFGIVDAGPVVGVSSGAKYTPALHTSGFHGGLSVANKYRVLLDYLDMRGWMFVELPRQVDGDCGFAYDVTSGQFGTVNPYDFPWSAPGGTAVSGQGQNAYDGAALGDAALYGRLWAAIDKARAGGVGFSFVLPPHTK